MTSEYVPNRCRLVLIGRANTDANQLISAMDGGDVASVILPQFDLDEASFQKLAEAIAIPVQEKDAALVIAGDSKIAGRVGADGIHLETSRSELSDAVARSSGRMIIGFGGAKTRHDCLEAGEIGPDYLFFGKFGYDKRPDVHPRSLALGQWWAEMVEIPGIVMAGNTMESVVSAAETGVDFVAVSELVFGNEADPATQVAKINALLDDVAPKFED